MSPTGNLGSVTARPSTWTFRPFRMWRGGPGVRAGGAPRALLLVRLLDRDPLDHDGPVDRVDAHDGPLLAPEVPAHDPHGVPLPDGKGPREADFRLLEGLGG